MLMERIYSFQFKPNVLFQSSLRIQNISLDRKNYLHESIYVLISGIIICILKSNVND